MRRAPSQSSRRSAGDWSRFDLRPSDVVIGLLALVLARILAV